MHFDFHLTFPDGFHILIELDGLQHFYFQDCFHRDETEFIESCKRDLTKERWAIAKDLSVVRVLQEDVWEDKLDWKGWLTKSIKNARLGEPKVIAPDAPEYASSNSAYFQVHKRLGTGEVMDAQTPE
jgi:hypothetical protein